jgi:niacin transporter
MPELPEAMAVKLSSKEVVVGALLAAIALLIPLAFRGWLQIVIPPFSATLAAHVPVMLAMFVGAGAAALTGIGSTLGFLVTLGPVVAARAFVHVWWGVLGAVLYRRGMSPLVVLLLMLPLHAAGEGAIILPLGVAPPAALAVAGGTALHHLADSAIALMLFPLLIRYFPRRPEG